jgi:hypothetical protein
MKRLSGQRGVRDAKSSELEPRLKYMAFAI